MRIARQEFQVARTMRDALSLETALFSISGAVVFADFAAARRFAHDLEHYRRAAGHPDPGARAGELAAMGMLHEVLHHLLAVHRDEQGADLPGRALTHLRESLGEESTEATLRAFCETFPPAAVYRGEKTVSDYLNERVEGLTGRERTVEELVLLRLMNENGACARYRELFDESLLGDRGGYAALFAEVERFYATVPAGSLQAAEVTPLGEAEPPAHTQGSVIDLLRAPAKTHPESLERQLVYLRDRHGARVGRFVSRILRSIDVLKEEEKEHATPGAPPPPAAVYRYDEAEDERFSPDTEWMPGVVMIAKSTLVWLHQLTRHYGREITRLDQVPDEELDRLAAAGFTSLWLIGVWERSPASRRIKHLCGNPEAEASAYALYTYDIAGEIGGWAALEELRRRCSDRGIRLASDMVPNHTGIDSPWVHDHPDWYVHAEEPPFPSYTFGGENLSGRPDAGVYLEDHYYDRSDAAVVFKHVDQDGRSRFIYHGNDGTSMPWNDTAQLNYLNPDVREAVIRTIIHVARNFPVIRFDAAMTLAKRHFRRLWFPEPGSGGDIASRAEHGLAREEFDRAMPQEFWREVVDRVAAEAPGTLLLAEAFWMMEGYFVRSLGMHRVYNSAFMNMLKREQNAEYREIIRNTLAFDPEILKRFVNFMNNPDEETAVTQFGTGDKYFGVCTLLATLPGLPMFGHGQIEGLAEKYGMEFRRPYWDEHEDEALVARHEHEIFPLLRRRRLFASAAHFRLYDLVDDGGSVNENAFVFTNANADERVLVAYNNSYERAEGTIRLSVPVQTEGGQRRSQIDEAFGLSDDESFLVFQEQRSSLWYLRRSAEIRERGLRITIDGYQSLVFWNVHERSGEQSSRLAQLEQLLDGAGVPDIDQALAGLAVLPLKTAFVSATGNELVTVLEEAMLGHRTLPAQRLSQLRLDYRALLDAVAELPRADVRSGSTARALTTLERHISTIVTLPHRTGGREESARFRAAYGHYYTGIRAHPNHRRTLAQWVLLLPVVEIAGIDRALEWGIDAWHEEAGDPRMVRLALRSADWHVDRPDPANLLRHLLQDEDARDAIGFHTNGPEYYHRESMADLLWMLFALSVIRLMSTSTLAGRTVRDRVVATHNIILGLEEANLAANGRVDLLLKAADQLSRHNSMIGASVKRGETSADSEAEKRSPDTRST